MATGTEVAVTKLMWALGYNVPENHIAYMRKEQLVVGNGAKFTPGGGKERAMRLSDIDQVPSGHTTVTFASATVLERHFGWKVGLPAYAVAGYVGISRVQMRRHNLSDVAFGAALGIVAGRTVTIGRGRSLELAPLATPSGAGVSFTWIGRK